jgi:hypothetical protein
MLTTPYFFLPSLPTTHTTVLSDKGAKVSEAYGSALDIPFLGRFSNRQTYIISPVRYVLDSLVFIILFTLQIDLCWE